MEIEVGDFIRTNRIEKVERIDKEDWTCVVTNRSAYNLQWLKNCNFKYSKNIIDLIEPGDIVEKCMVMYVDKNEICVNNSGKKIFNANEILGKSILTHEQYEQNCYRLEE